MKSYTVNIPGFTIGGDDAYAAIETVCATYGKTVAILGGETALAKARPALEAALQKTSLEVTDWRMYGKQCRTTGGNTYRCRRGYVVCRRRRESD